MSWAATDAGGAAVPYVEQIRADVAAIAAVLRAHGPGRPIAHCPGWAVGDAVQHLGEVHRWATEIVRTGAVVDLIEAPPPADPDVLETWFVDGAEQLCLTLDGVDPERECWTFGFPPARAGFWRRRQALETVVHRVDVALATGEPTDIPLPIASRGVAEVAEFMFPRQVALDRTPPLVAPIALRATDTGDVWRIGEPGPTVAEIAGPTSALLLLLWRRPHDPVERDGDPAALAAFDAAVLVP